MRLSSSHSARSTIWQLRGLETRKYITLVMGERESNPWPFDRKPFSQNFCWQSLQFLFRTHFGDRKSFATNKTFGAVVVVAAAAVVVFVAAAVVVFVAAAAVVVAFKSQLLVQLISF